MSMQYQQMATAASCGVAVAESLLWVREDSFPPVSQQSATERAAKHLLLLVLAA